MRFSVERGDRAYDPSHARRIKRVTVDGREVPMAITADEEEGLVRHIAANPDGSPIVAGGQMSVLESRGRVVVEMVKEDRAWDAERTGEARVAVARHPSGDLLVQVYSLARPGAIKQMRCEALHVPSDGAALCQKAGAMAGAAAELLCDQFNDKLDPSECARVAVEQALAMVRDEHRTRGDVYDAA